MTKYVRVDQQPRPKPQAKPQAKPRAKARAKPRQKALKPYEVAASKLSECKVMLYNLSKDEIAFEQAKVQRDFEKIKIEPFVQVPGEITIKIHFGVQMLLSFVIFCSTVLKMDDIFRFVSETEPDLLFRAIIQSCNILNNGNLTVTLLEIDGRRSTITLRKKYGLFFGFYIIERFGWQYRCIWLQ